METIQLATLGGGCFWCLEAVFIQLKGVVKAESGYAGGQTPSPSYQAVCTGTTGHAEVVQVSFSPEEISFQDLLRVFFSIHDPTTLNRQGGDVGTQYRSVIFYHNDEQKKQAEAILAELSFTPIWDNPIVTEISPLEIFYKAEDYHQNYFNQNPNQPYCQAIINPKVAKFRKTFLSRLKPF